MAARQSRSTAPGVLRRFRSSTLWSIWTRPASASTSWWSQTRPSSGSRCWLRSASGRRSRRWRSLSSHLLTRPGSSGRLEEAVRRLRDAGVEATGHLGDGDPLQRRHERGARRGRRRDHHLHVPEDELRLAPPRPRRTGPQGDGPTGRPRRRRAERDRGGDRLAVARRTRARAPPAGRAPELARRRAPARHVPLHRLGDHALRVVLHRVLLRAGRQRARRWPPAPYELPVYLALLNTIILVSSSFTMHWALHVREAGTTAQGSSRASS